MRQEDRSVLIAEELKKEGSVEAIGGVAKSPT